MMTHPSLAEKRNMILRQINGRGPHEPVHCPVPDEPIRHQKRLAGFTDVVRYLRPMDLKASLVAMKPVYSNLGGITCVFDHDDYDGTLFVRFVICRDVENFKKIRGRGLAAGRRKTGTNTLSLDFDQSETMLTNLYTHLVKMRSAKDYMTEEVRTLYHTMNVITKRNKKVLDAIDAKVSKIVSTSKPARDFEVENSGYCTFTNDGWFKLKLDPISPELLRHDYVLVYNERWPDKGRNRFAVAAVAAIKAAMTSDRRMEILPTHYKPLVAPEAK